MKLIIFNLSHQFDDKVEINHIMKFMKVTGFEKDSILLWAGGRWVGLFDNKAI